VTIRLGRSLLGSAGLRVANAGLGFAVAVVLARTLGADGYGLYSTAFVVASVCAMVVKFGLPNLVMRETATAAVSEDWAHMRAVWGWAGRGAALFSLAVLTVGAVTLFFLRDRLDPGHTLTYGLALALIPLLAFGALRAGALRGLQHVVLAQVPEMIVKPGVMLALALLLGLAVPATASTAMAMQLAAVAAAFVLGAVFLWRRRPEELRLSAEYRLPSNIALWKPALTMGLATGMNQLNNYTDILLLSLFHPGADVGVYRVAYQIAILSLFGQQTVAMVFAPEFARFKQSGNIADLQHRARLMARLSVVPPLVVLAIYLAFGAQVQSVVFGKDYISAVPAVLILTTGQLIAAVYAASGYLLTMTGHERDYLRLKTVGAVINLTVGLLLVPGFGIFGAAISTLLAMIFVNVAAGHVCKKIARTRVTPW